MIDRVLLELFFISIHLKSKSQQTILLTPITEVYVGSVKCCVNNCVRVWGKWRSSRADIAMNIMKLELGAHTVDSKNIPSCTFVEVGKETTNDRGSKVASMERLGHIRR
jgi:hypothetical protein